MCMYLRMKPLWICLVTLLCTVSAVPYRRQRELLGEARKLLKKHDYGIVGGSQATIEKYPYTVSITYDPQKFLIGGGAIINKKWIVCSAYEIQDFKTSEKQISVKAGSNKAESGGQKVNVSKIIMHKNFNGSYQYDVALIKTGIEIEFGNLAKPVRLAKKKPKKGTKAQLTGYGDTLATSGDLLVATVEVKPESICSSQHGELGDTCMCADGKDVGPCYSDLGDPLVYNKQLIGWYLGGDLCNYYDLVEIYSNVASLRSWIRKTIKNNSDNEEIQGIDNEEFYAAYDNDVEEHEHTIDEGENW